MREGKAINGIKQPRLNIRNKNHFMLLFKTVAKSKSNAPSENIYLTLKRLNKQIDPRLAQTILRDEMKMVEDYLSSKVDEMLF